MSKASIDTAARNFVTFDLWLTVYRLHSLGHLSTSFIPFRDHLRTGFLLHLFRDFYASQTDVSSPRPGCSQCRDFLNSRSYQFGSTTEAVPWQAPAKQAPKQLRKYINFYEFKIYKNLILKSSCLASSPTKRLSFFLISFVTLCIRTPRFHSSSSFTSFPNPEWLPKPFEHCFTSFSVASLRQCVRIDAYSAQLPFYKWKFAIGSGGKLFCILCRKDAPGEPQTTPTLNSRSI